MTAKSKASVVSMKLVDDTWIVKLDREVMMAAPRDELWILDLDNKLDEIEVYKRAKELLNLED